MHSILEFGCHFVRGIMISRLSRPLQVQPLETPELTLQLDNWDIHGPEENAMSTRPPKRKINQRDNELNQSVPPGHNLCVRGPGFMEIYNPNLPLNELWQLIEHVPFSAHIKDIRFTSERERGEAMRPIWNSSSAEICTDVVSAGLIWSDRTDSGCPNV